MAEFIVSVDPQAGGDGPDRSTLVGMDSPGPVADPRGSLRHLLIGEPALVRETIRQIHLGRYRVDMLLWSGLLTIPEQGLVIPKYRSQVLAFLQKPEHLTPRGETSPPASLC
jgi:hypothetical protein